jgi:hypothetical protein
VVLSRTRRSRAAGSGGFFGPPTLHRGPDEPQYFADHRRRNPLYRNGFRCNYTFGTGTTGAPFADCAPPVAFFPAFGFEGAASGFVASGSGCAASPKFWTRFQIWLAAALLVLKPFTG